MKDDLKCDVCKTTLEPYGVKEPQDEDSPKKGYVCPNNECEKFGIIKEVLK